MTTTRGGPASQLVHVYQRFQEYQAPGATVCISFLSLMVIRNTIILFFSFAFLSSQNRCSVAQKWIKAGYWYGGSDFPIPDINSALFTHLLCAFANVNSSTYELSIPSDFQQNFSNFTGIVKRKNPSIVTLLSIWNGQAETYKSMLGEAVNSSVLSSMLTQSSYRKSFIDSSVKTARTLGFQGIDLFWLWPNSTDLSNIGTLLDEWRATVDSEPRNSSVSKLILTMGVRYSPSLQSVSYPINSMKRNLDWAHVVAYDYHMPSRENFTGNHAALYNPSSNISTDFGIREWLSGGYPANKLLLGMPYHGYAWELVDPSDNSLGAPASGPGVTTDGSIGYRFVRSFIQNYGYGARSVYNSTYVVNYFVSGSTWINFDDVETVRAKISYAKEKGLLGYNVFQVIHDDKWALSLAAQDEVHQGKRSWLWLKIVLPIALISILSASLMFYYRRRLFKREATGTRVLGDRSFSGRGTSLSAAAENFDGDAPILQVFSFESIKTATNNFSRENQLGEGGFGPVYKGKLPRGLEIAVKRLSASSTQGLEEFKNEVSLTARLQHVNLVRLLGFCSERGEKMLIYEYMPNKSLDLYLFDPIRRYSLDWSKRVRIIEGVTQGLLYLQEKDVHEANTSRIVGTYGYVPPEYARKGIYSIKYDVYSFGVVLLQIISGKTNTRFYGENEDLHLLEYAYDLWKNGRGMEFIDPFLDDSSSPCKLLTCMQVALLCVQENPDARPTMLEAFSMLKNDDSQAIATPERPGFSERKKGDMETASSSQQIMCSFNDSQVSQLEPR
ncbi:PREDICTED: wall-associated receptor kinase-like 5 isoform X2 [Populus euphratica]|uniref:Wall-associated receptor kinase-like 5 isoform X2 n=1 Tax=Populus euphratica TaxID=75702 RepID=A0AAJ6TVN9_POPEU|nr:PREDICTED: wall-associated receptor kinase-like 5 isoform X2 [Populus euphratica]